MTRIINKWEARQSAQAAPADEDELVDEGGRDAAPVPVLRLRRLGASDALIDHLAGLWSNLDGEQAADMAAAMANMGDRELLVALVGEPAEGQDPDAWADANTFPTDAARVVAMAAG